MKNRQMFILAAVKSYHQWWCKPTDSFVYAPDL